MARWQVKATDARRLAMAGAAALAMIAVVAMAVLLTGAGKDGGDVAAVGARSKAAAPTTEAPAPAVAPATTAPTTVPPTTAEPATPPTTAGPPGTAAPTTASPSTEVPATPTPSAAPAPAPDGGGALCVGDSVMLGAGPEYANTLAMCGTVDATESRQASEGPQAVGAHAPYPSTVVVHLGTNGTVDGADLDAILGELAGTRRVVVVNVQHNGTRSWEGQANAEIAGAVARHANAVLADWKGESGGHADWFAGDGIHLSAAGAEAYAGVIAAAL